ncbi:PREDICTED: nucleolar protein 12-like [Camelina sativa]|uniref:Nucleolar protein 12-like n=1 Tax=Camelina sativa TaxID=90675 RepID=A0ABM0Z2F4_CAMSA|nr:PREDICTED: nucleolar protein 12-like [Camelina sativa]
MSEEEEDEEEEEEEEYEESEEDDNVRIYDSDEEYEDVDEAMARESRCAEEERSKKKNDERQKKWRMMNSWKVGLGAEEDVDVVVRKDMREETREWTKHGGEVEEAVSDLELSIFFFLIDEFSHELVSSSP